MLLAILYILAQDSQQKCRIFSEKLKCWKSSNFFNFGRLNFYSASHIPWPRYLDIWSGKSLWHTWRGEPVVLHHPNMCNDGKTSCEICVMMEKTSCEFWRFLIPYTLLGMIGKNNAEERVQLDENCVSGFQRMNTYSSERLSNIVQSCLMLFYWNFDPYTFVGPTRSPQES